MTTIGLANGIFVGMFFTMVVVVIAIEKHLP
jgi:hypothetical protein